MNSGFFITLEGGEGSGKSVQCSKLYERLMQCYGSQSVVKTREPGGSAGAELIRNMLLTGEVDRWFPVSEMLLFYAARYDHWRRTILPTLLRGGIVICDRFFDSSVVYQGGGHGIPRKYFDAIHEMFEDIDSERSFFPDRTYVLDIEPHEGVARSNARISQSVEQEDRFERIDIAFHQKVRHEYLAILDKNPARCVKIDASQSIEQIHHDIWQDLTSVLTLHGFEQILPLA
ncbi:MAG: dTMP kinase [Holosporales bacterium]|jgi:dTMP kinase|nr:dTMP kinase [Holosporales bacterium]